MHTTFVSGEHLTPLSYDQFDIAHECFERSSDQQSLILQWLKHFISATWPDLNSFSLLSVGCGSGVLDTLLIDHLSFRFPSVQYCGVEPNPTARKRFLASLNSRPASRVRFSLYEHAIESYQPETKVSCIQLIQTIYYLADPAKTIERLLTLLEQGGKLVVMVAPFEKLNGIIECYRQQHSSHKAWFSDSLECHLQQYHVPYRKHRINASLNISPCFQPESKKGKALLDFITQVKTEFFDDDVRQLCLNY